MTVILVQTLKKLRTVGLGKGDNVGLTSAPASCHARPPTTGGQVSARHHAGGGQSQPRGRQEEWFRLFSGHHTDQQHRGVDGGEEGLDQGGRRRQPYGGMSCNICISLAIMEYCDIQTIRINITTAQPQVDLCKVWKQLGDSLSDSICYQVDIAPGEKEALLISRNQDGNYGTIAYSLGHSGLQLIVMWTSGMNCDHYANFMAIGVTDSLNSDKFR